MFASLIFVFTVSSRLIITYASPKLYQEDNNCVLPPYPKHGRYSVSSHPSATPGERYSNVKLDISCDTGYQTNNNIKRVLCVNGDWSASMPTCVRDSLGFCALSTDDLKVEYRCLLFPGTLERSWECESLVPSGTLVRPICRFPGYFSLRELSEMRCRDGKWDYTPICTPACGLTTQHRQLEGISSKYLELPWHAVIYGKWFNPYEQICGGSLITATKIISAASCFNKELSINNWLSPVREFRPASEFVVAVNKMYRPYNDTRDRNSQYSDVAEFIVPSTYRIYATHADDNIAIVVVKTPFFFHLSVRPVCLDFDNDLDSTQLTDGNSGKAAYWSSVDGNGQSPKVLKVVDTLFIKYEDCNASWFIYLREAPKNQFCARYNYAIAPSTLDSGSGLAFLESSTQRYFLRGARAGVVIVPLGKIITMQTQIVKYEQFIKQHL